MNTLFMIYNSDGETFVRIVTPEEVLQDIKDNGNKSSFMSSLPNVSDTNYWAGPILIRGEIVCPTPVEIVKTYEIK